MKRYLAECIGTFFLALAVNLTGDPLAIGLMFMAMVYIIGPVSGCHINPAVSLAKFVQGRISLQTMAFYMVAQSIGAVLFFGLAYGIFGQIIPSRIIPQDALLGAATFELLLTMVLCSVIIVVTSRNRFRDGHVNGLIIGLTLSGLATFPGLYNPALALGSMIANFVAGQATTMPGAREAFVYLLLPLLGGVCAALKYNYFYRNLPDDASTIHHHDDILILTK